MEKYDMLWTVYAYHNETGSIVPFNVHADTMKSAMLKLEHKILHENFGAGYYGTPIKAGYQTKTEIIF